MTGSALVLRGDARHLPLPDASVDLVVTSPPYFALRSYTDGGEHYAGQIGAEPTPAEYIASLLDCTREWVRVLKPGGSIWVNLGDKYSGAQAQNVAGVNRAGDSARTWRQTDPTRTGIPNKSLMMLPERYRIACVDQLGLIARAVLVWSKPNGLPESVTDRVRRSHEDWVHLTKQPRYFSAVDEIREAHAPWTLKAYAYEQRNGGYNRRKNPNRIDEGDASDYAVANPLGKLPGSVWEVATEPLKVPDHIAHAVCCAGRKRKGCEDGVDHFAAFPTEWPRRIILGWSPSGICVECGEGRRPVAARQLEVLRSGDAAGRAHLNGEGVHGADRRAGTHGRSTSIITGEACACPEPTAPTRPAVVLDPFGGTGTTALVARALGRIGITVDRSADYCRLAGWRTTDRSQLAKAMRVPPPPKVHDAQLDLFGEVA